VIGKKFSQGGFFRMALLRRNKIYLSISLLLAFLVFPVLSYGADPVTVAWYTILPDNENPVIQQERTIKALEITLHELESVIDQELQAGHITDSTDFTTNGKVALVYDYLMYRIYKVMELDKQILHEFDTQERILRDTGLSEEMINRYLDIKDKYIRIKKAFFDSLYGLKRAVRIGDLKYELARMHDSVKVLHLAMNVYASSRIVSASR